MSSEKRSSFYIQKCIIKTIVYKIHKFHPIYSYFNIFSVLQYPQKFTKSYRDLYLLSWRYNVYFGVDLLDTNGVSDKWL